MKTTRPTLRVSHLTYIRVMDSLIAETATLAPAEAMQIIAAVTAYLHSPEAPIPAAIADDELLRRYIDIIDRAAIRSARARRAALARRQAKDEPAPTTTPISPVRQISPISPIPPKSPRPRIKIKHKSPHANPHRYAKKSFAGRMAHYPK